MHTILHGVAAIGYAALALWAWHNLSRRERAAPVLPQLERVGLLAALLLHGAALTQSVFAEHGLRFGFALALSCTLWIGVVIFWIESLLVSTGSLRVLILPAAAVGSLLPLIFPTARAVPYSGSVAFTAHWIIAVFAYGTLAIAAIHALLMMAVDRRLHAGLPVAEIPAGSWIPARVLDELPPLLTMERLLFRLIGAGFLLLTLAILAGVAFSENLFGRAMRLDHKTVFTVLAWLTFGALLLGRLIAGWRGRTALRFTLSGFALMLFAYIGSRFVLEVLLHR
jgi:ABC-type uncharacterized transport system permease subunit